MRRWTEESRVGHRSDGEEMGYDEELAMAIEMSLIDAAVGWMEEREEVGCGCVAGKVGGSPKTKWKIC